jgi:predicted DNA-binding protein YlxM (UPF0122 family)
MKKINITEASEFFGVSKEAIHNRIRRGSLQSDIENGIKIVNRKGKRRIKLSDNLKKANNSDYYVNRTNSKGIIITTSNFSTTFTDYPLVERMHSHFPGVKILLDRFPLTEMEKQRAIKIIQNHGKFFSIVKPENGKLEEEFNFKIYFYNRFLRNF